MRPILLAPLISIVIAGSAVLSAAHAEERVNAPFVPTPEAVVERMMALARPTPQDVLYDLGSGDGRIPITAARVHGVRKAVGIDIDPVRIAESQANAQSAGVTDRVSFVNGDVFGLEFGDASIVTMYLLQDLNIELRPRLLSELKPGSRIVSHQFHLGDWVADDSLPISDVAARLPGPRVDDDADMLYLWIVPARIDGVWEWTAGGQPWRLSVQQTYQKFDAGLTVARRALKIEDGRIAGTRVQFEGRADFAGREVPVRFDGTVSGNIIRGSMAVDGTAHAVTARRAQ